MHRLLRHVRAHGVAYVALFVALGGTSYAASGLPKNSVSSKQIATGAVHTSDIANNAVTGAKVKANTLKGADIDESSLGKVPSAASADSAASATTAVNATNATSAANAAALGGLAPSAFQRGIRWALVNAAGTAIIAQSGGVVLVSHPNVGETFLDFGETTSGHAMWAQPSQIANAARSTTVTPCGAGPDVSSACPGPTLTHIVAVVTWSVGGAPIDTAVYVYYLPGSG
jgi:hypothetical protein